MLRLDIHVVCRNVHCQYLFCRLGKTKRGKATLESKHTIHCKYTPVNDNHWQVNGLTLITSTHFNALLGNLGRWHSCWFPPNTNDSPTHNSLSSVVYKRAVSLTSVQHAVMNELLITLMQTITWNNNRTSGFVVRFLPVKNDERRAALHSDHSEVRRRYAGRTSHVLITSLLIREVSEGWGDGARLIRLLIGLVDHMGGYRQVQWKQHF